jgi:type I restriction enzyme S subunit
MKEKRAAVITRAVTKGLNPNVPMKDSGVEWLGEIPVHWGAKKIKRLTAVKRGASPRPIDDPKYFDIDGEFAWVRISDVSASDKYLEETEQQLSSLGSSLSVKQYPGDLFLSIAATVGKPIISKIKCCIHDGFVWFPNLKLNREHLYYIFETGSPFHGLGKLGTQLNLNTDTIGDIFIPLPPTSEIEAIVKYINTEAIRIDSIISKIQSGIEKLKEYRTALISAAVTGKIDVRGE